MHSRVTTTMALAAAVVVATASVDGVPLAVLNKRLSSMGKKNYTVIGAIDRVFTHGASGLDQWVAAAVALVIFGAFIVALYGAWRILNGQRDGTSMWVSSIGGLVLLIGLTGFVL